MPTPFSYTVQGTPPGSCAVDLSCRTTGTSNASILPSFSSHSSRLASTDLQARPLQQLLAAGIEPRGDVGTVRLQARGGLP